MRPLPPPERCSRGKEVTEETMGAERSGSLCSVEQRRPSRRRAPLPRKGGNGGKPWERRGRLLSCSVEQRGPTRSRAPPPYDCRFNRHSVSTALTGLPLGKGRL